MNEYITRSAAVAVLHCNCDEKCSAVVSDMENIPSEDVAPVVHGKWILEREPDGTAYCFHCSVCDNDFHYIGIKTASDYCPNCGAKMGL